MNNEQKPFYKRIWFIVLVGVTVLTFFAGLGGNKTDVPKTETTIPHVDRTYAADLNMFRQRVVESLAAQEEEIFQCTDITYDPDKHVIMISYVGTGCTDLMVYYPSEWAELQTIMIKWDLELERVAIEECDFPPDTQVAFLLLNDYNTDNIILAILHGVIIGDAATA